MSDQNHVLQSNLHYTLHTHTHIPSAAKLLPHVVGEVYLDLAL